MVFALIAYVITVIAIFRKAHLLTILGVVFLTGMLLSGPQFTSWDLSIGDSLLDVIAYINDHPVQNMVLMCASVVALNIVAMVLLLRR